MTWCEASDDKHLQWIRRNKASFFLRSFSQTEDAIFVATGVCEGWIPGVSINGDIAQTSTILVDVKSSAIIKINNSDNNDKISIIYFFVPQLSLRPTVRLKINFSEEDSISWQK